jgi:RNA recognition motif-containing protein
MCVWVRSRALTALTQTRRAHTYAYISHKTGMSRAPKRKKTKMRFPISYTYILLHLPFRKLFVGGLSWETTQENLQRFFGRYGEVIDCVVMKNSESGRSRGFGFVTFSDPSNVGIVLQNGPHQLDGRTV